MAGTLRAAALPVRPALAVHRATRRLNPAPGATDPLVVDVQQLALVQGMADTRSTLRGWADRPLGVLGGWLAGSAAIAAALLAAVAAIGTLAVPDPREVLLPGLNEPARLQDVGAVLLRNGLVLALHALACVAGFIAGRSLPLQAEHLGGWRRRAHELAAPAALLFVAAATVFSLLTQAYVLGRSAADLAGNLGVAPVTVVLSVVPHALPELVALFLPLAAWLSASRRGAWVELLAATLVTTAVAVPVLFTAAVLEVHVWPSVLRALSPLA